MRKMKKLLSMLLTVIMVLAMAAPSFAAEVPTTGTITVSNAKPGHTYNAYKIFNLTMVSDGEGYAYTLTDEWKEFFTTGEGKNFVKLNGDNLVPFNQNGENGEPVLIQDTKGLAAAIRDALEGKNIAATGTYSGEGEGSLTLKNGNNENLALGYYLVDSTVGTLCALNTNAPNVKFEDKSKAPEITKTVPEGKSNVAIGETIPYTVTITAQEGAQNYVVVDILSKGLTFKNDVVVTKNNEVVVKEEVSGEAKPISTYSCKAPVDDSTKVTTLTITFADAFCNALVNDDKIVITYSADVNEEAITVDKVNNTVKLNYGHGTDINSTPSTSVESKTYQFDLQKTVMGSDGQSTNTQLDGAKFKLYDAKTEGNLIKLVAMENSGDKKVYRVAKTGETGIEEIEAGYAIIKGLDTDVSYFLEESAAPAGYNAITERFEVKPVRVANAVDAPATPEAQIANSTGALLPSTGGIGTTIFYAAGIVLMAGAVFFVVRRKKA